MKAALPATVIAVFLLISTSRADDSAPAYYPIPGQSNHWVGRLGERLKGRILGTLVQSGMAREQVTQLAGEGELTLFFNNRGVLTAGLWFYPDYGFSVFCDSDNVGVLRVEQVTFWPFFE
jgi:hypothetical protein